MIWLSNSTLARLRDQLRARGQRPSFVLGNTTQMTPEEAQLAAIEAEYGPLCEAMYLMMSADGSVGQEEREVLKGALRNLSSDEIRSIHIEAMLDKAQKLIKDEGREKRMQSVIEALDGDPARAEVAFVLAAAIAFADNAIADEENETLNAFAEGLGIDESRANSLLDNVESDMKEKQ